MRDITYCSHLDCCYKNCERHQSNALKDKPISIADLNDGYCFTPALVDNYVDSRKKLLAAICNGTQKTAYKCSNAARALCDVAGSCAYCSVIADTIEEAFK